MFLIESLKATTTTRAATRLHASSPPPHIIVCSTSTSSCENPKPNYVPSTMLVYTRESRAIAWIFSHSQQSQHQ